jgi:hypothetical protein
VSLAVTFAEGSHLIPDSLDPLARALELPRFIDEPRHWAYIWKDAPGMIFGGASDPCCNGGGSGFTTEIVSYSGGGSGNTGAGHAETYAAATDTWTTTANPTHPTAAFGDTAVTGAAIMVFVGPALALTDAWISGGWTAEGNPPTSGWQLPQQGPSTITGTVGWIFGGFGASSGASNQNIESNVSTWTTKTSMPATKGEGRGATIGATSKSYAFMGITGAPFGSQTATGYEYDQAGDSWATSASGSASRYHTGSFAFDSVPAIFIVGGQDSAMEYTLNEEFSGGSFTTRAAFSFAVQVPRGDQITSVSAGFLNGGLLSGSATSGNAEYVIDTWTSKTGMINSRGSHGSSAF